METGLFLYLAHPDVMLGRYPVFDETAAEVSRKLCREAKRLNIPMEYNLYGVYKGVKPGCLGYPCDAFWRIAAEENCTAVVGVDAHNPGCFEATPMEPAVEYLRGLGITVLEDPTNP
jgi:histidinol-phosphatase (PHP family)